jgi:hypothetical protein
MGAIVGIRRQEESLQYLFECKVFKQWLGIGKLDKVESAEEPIRDEDGEIEYKQFDVTLTIMNMRERQVVQITVHLSDIPYVAYEVRFPMAQLEQAKGLHGFLITVGSVTESLLSTLGMEKA